MLGKYGSFPANQILGRPYYLTFEIGENEDKEQLRIVPAAEMHADALAQQAVEASSAQDGHADEPQTNQYIVDEATNQRLTMAEIEALKSSSNGSRDIIARMLESHSAIDQKTAFSLAKYTLRKHRKYLKRFSVLPLDVVTLTDWLMHERDSSKYMELRNEMIALSCSWSNVYRAVDVGEAGSRDYLVVDDTGGLLVAAMAERMGLLHVGEASNESACAPIPGDPASSEHQNSITLIHSNSQPNLALLRYFGFDINAPNPLHPLSTQLKTLSWRQLLAPESDQACAEPAIASPEVLASWKSTRRGNYYRKRRRWSSIMSVVNGTRQGGFQALLVASHTSEVSLLRHAVPLLAGGAQVVVFSPNLEPLTELADAYSTARRTGFINTPEEERLVPSEGFPVDPTLLLAVSIQTAKLNQWQVLPGRTHPFMTSQGGAEGYIFVATRVHPATGKTQARGTTGGKKRKVLEDA